MEGDRFCAGQFVQTIFWEDGTYIERGKADCVSIKVVMENGQMAGVPWFLVTYTPESGLRTTKHNGASVAGVQLIPLGEV